MYATLIVMILMTTSYTSTFIHIPYHKQYHKQFNQKQHLREAIPPASVQYIYSVLANTSALRDGV